MPASTLKLISSIAARELLRDLADQYEAATGRSVVTEAAGGVDVAKRIAAGEAADVVVLSDTAIDKLIADDKLLAGSRVDLVRSGVAIAVRDGAPRPDIASEDAVKQAVLAARTLSFSTSRSCSRAGASSNSSGAASSCRRRARRSVRWWPAAARSSASSSCPS